jgi:twitching motility protein PilT
VPDIDKRLKTFLATAIKNKASDLHIQPNSKPHIRIDETLRALSSAPLTPQESEEIILSTMEENTKKFLLENHEADYALNIPNMGRFRVNTFMAQGALESVIRIISLEPKSIADLRLPASLEEMVQVKDGLILIAGSTGSGKSSTLSGMIDFINGHYAKRIITIENPVEILHTNKKSLITQREIGIDAKSFAGALRSVLRQDPDVIMVGEIRDKETADAAIQAAQTGHLVLSTIHAGNSEEAIIRLTNLFPLNDRENVRETIAVILKGIVVQKLLLDVNKQTVPVVEILVNTSRVQDLVSGKTASEGFQKVISEGGYSGMQTMDQHLVDLAIKKIISVDTAINNAVHPQFVKGELKQIGMIQTSTD